MNPQALCWIDQQIIPAIEAKVSVFDHGLLYGDGVFEGLRFYHGQIFMLDAHLERLQRSANAISLKAPFSFDQIKKALLQLVDQYQSPQGYIRLVITRGAGSLGIDPISCKQPNLFIIADSLSVIPDAHAIEGISLHVASIRRIPVECLDPSIKSLNYLNNILARIEARQAGMDEAVLLNTQGFISEGSVDNIFIIKQGVLKTPPTSDGLLHGITRQVILNIADMLGIESEQTHLTVDDLTQSDECFLTGTGAELISVRQVSGVDIPKVEKSIFNTISQAFKQTIDRQCLLQST